MSLRFGAVCNCNVTYNILSIKGILGKGKSKYKCLNEYIKSEKWEKFSLARAYHLCRVVIWDKVVKTSWVYVIEAHHSRTQLPSVQKI